ncbi:MAG TPA: diheme cytochrome c-553 [Myxococcaceae bacterium]|nr:diheme cytochrome c-553 [Myxococcaceae bacterium]
MRTIPLLALLPAVALAAEKVPAPADRIERGRYLVTIAACNDCHTPLKFDQELKMPVPDMSRMLSGHPEGAPDPSSEYKGSDMLIIGPTLTSFKLQFGVVYSPNLTPDKATGLGGWTEEMFLSALRTGKHMGGSGRAILPPMPWAWFGRMTDEDLKAIFAYLRSIPAVKNEVPPPKVPAAALDGISVSTQKLVERMKGAEQTTGKKSQSRKGAPARPGSGQ